MSTTLPVFVPRLPLTAAELHVEFPKIDAHIIERRRILEQATLPAARRVANAAVELHGFPAIAAVDRLAARLEQGLSVTARFGYREAIAEIERHRASQPTLAEWSLPDPGGYMRLAREGLLGVAVLIRRRAKETAEGVARAAAQALAASNDTDLIMLAAQAKKAAQKTLHLHVLELIGETLNAGRTAGALSLPSPPEFAMRSEQLDTNTCAICDQLHGTIATVGSPEYWAMLPPQGCLGGGRCRGLVVFADGPRDVRQPDRLAA